MLQTSKSIRTKKLQATDYVALFSIIFFSKSWLYFNTQTQKLDSASLIKQATKIDEHLKSY